MRMRRMTVALLIAVMMLITACTSQPSQKPSTAANPAPASPAPASKNGGTLRVAYSVEPSSLAPWRNGDQQAHYVYFALYNTLVDQNDKMEIVPSLAESWSVSPDGKTWTFKLRKDVKFHDGTPFDAEAVKFNVELWTKNPPNGAINTTKVITGVNVIDPYTVEMNLAAPNNRLLITLSGKGMSMLSPTAVRTLGEDFGRKPVGTGPFKFEKWVTDSTITLVKNPDYWAKDSAGNKLPYLDKLEFRLIGDASVRKTAILSNEVDFDTNVAAENADEVLAGGKVEVFNKPGMGYIGLRLLMTKPPFNKKEVRQAVAWAVDREAINKAVFFGRAFPGYTMYSPPTPGFRPDITPYGPRNVGKAKELLTAAGYPNGIDMDLIVAEPLYKTIGELLQAQLKDAGIRVKIRMLERGTFLDGIVKREHQSYLDDIIGRADPSQYYSHLECKATYNGHEYCNPTVDQMALKDGVEKFTSLSDPKRIELYQQAEQIVLDEVPFVPLIHQPVLMAWSKSFSDIVITPAGRIFWTQAYQTKK